MSKEAMERGDDVRMALTSFVKKVRKVIGEEKTREIFREIAKERWEWAKKSAAERWEKLGGFPSRDASLEELADFATKSHAIAFGEGVFPWEFKEGKIVGTASPDYCRFKEFVVGEPILCEFCFTMWREGVVKYFDNLGNFEVKQTRAYPGVDKCIVWFTP